MNKTFYLILLIILSLTGCDDLDRNYEDMVPPVLTGEAPSVFGIITDKSGTPVQDAVVQVGNLTAKTGSSGFYYFRHILSGSYAVSIKASGMTDIEDSITVPDIDDLLVRCVPFNAVLSSSSRIVKKDIKADSGGNLTTATEAFAGNEKALISIELKIPANALVQDATVFLHPVYDASLLSDGGGMLVGARLDGATFKNTATLNFTVDEELGRIGFVIKKTDGQWKKVNSIYDEGVISVEVSETGTYGIFVPMALTEKISVKNLIFEQSVWDNIHGGNWLKLPQFNYSYQSGTESPAAGKTVLAALLAEKLAANYGTISKEVADSCWLDITLPVGVRFSLSGRQELKKITLSAGNTNVSCNTYGNVSIWGKAVDREDTGGSN